MKPGIALWLCVVLGLVAAHWHYVYEVAFDVTMLVIVVATDWTEGPF